MSRSPSPMMMPHKKRPSVFNQRVSKFHKMLKSRFPQYENKQIMGMASRMASRSMHK